MLGKLKRLLKNREAQNRAMAEWIFTNICEFVRRGDQGKDLIIVKSRPQPEIKAQVEAGFLKANLIKENPALSQIFSKGWSRHVKTYNVTASFPRPGGERQTLLYLASFDQPWDSLTLEDVLAGTIDGAAMDFYEEADKLAHLTARGKL
jgi:hypothetical protein